MEQIRDTKRKRQRRKKLKSIKREKIVEKLENNGKLEIDSEQSNRKRKRGKIEKISCLISILLL